MKYMRNLIAPAALTAAILAGCNAPSGPTEEERAAELIHGLKDKLTFPGKGTISQSSSSPAKFELSHPQFSATFTISKQGKCIYHSEASIAGGTVDWTVDLSKLEPEGYPKTDTEPGETRVYRFLKGAALTCTVVTRGNFDPNIVCPNAAPQTVALSFASIRPAEFKELATKFKQDFCQ